MASTGETEEERRWAAGGQGKVRQDKKRSARMRAWANGEWIPSWLKKFREEKEERDRLRREQPAVDEEEENDAGDGGDETGLWQQPSGLEEEEVSFMERPGLTGDEYVGLVNGGVPLALARRLEQLLRRYEHYLSSDRGAVARWALGRWLVTSQIGAGVQDRAEEPIVARARDGRHFPLRREPDDNVLRCELLQWTSEITQVMGEIYVHGANAAHPGELRAIPQQQTVGDVLADLGSDERMRTSSNSNNRRPRGEAGGTGRSSSRSPRPRNRPAGVPKSLVM